MGQWASRACLLLHRPIERSVPRADSVSGRRAWPCPRPRPWDGGRRRPSSRNRWPMTGIACAKAPIAGTALPAPATRTAAIPRCLRDAGKSGRGSGRSLRAAGFRRGGANGSQREARVAPCSGTGVEGGGEEYQADCRRTRGGPADAAGGRRAGPVPTHGAATPKGPAGSIRIWTLASRVGRPVGVATTGHGARCGRNYRGPHRMAMPWPLGWRDPGPRDQAGRDSINRSEPTWPSVGTVPPRVTRPFGWAWRPGPLGDDAE